MSTATILVASGLVIVNGRAIGGIDMSSVPAGVRVVQWDGQEGHVEYKPDADGDFVANQDITDLTPFQAVINLWQTAANAEDTPVEPARPAPPTVTALKSYLALKRYHVEVGGMVSPNYGQLDTDRDTVAMMAQIIQSIKLGIVTQPVLFKTPSGFVPLSLSDFMAILAQISAFVQNCFNKEAALDAQIDAGAITTTAEIDAQYAA